MILKNILTSILLLIYSFGYSQSEMKPNISAALGASYSLLHMSSGKFQSGCVGGLAGIFIERQLKPNMHQWNLQLGFIYHYRQIKDYESAPYAFTAQWYKPIHVNTNVKQQLFETQLIVKYRSDKSKFSFGAGANISFLFQNTLNQDVYEPLDSINSRRILYNYERKNDTGIHSYNRFNIAPTLNIGFRLTEKIELEYYLGYDLLAPDQVYLNFEQYRLLSNSIFIKLRID